MFWRNQGFTNPFQRTNNNNGFYNTQGRGSSSGYGYNPQLRGAINPQLRQSQGFPQQSQHPGRFAGQHGQQQGFPPQGQQQTFPQNGQPPLQQGQFPNQTGRQQGFPPQGQQQAFPQNGQPPMQQGQFPNQTGRQQGFPPQGQQQAFPQNGQPPLQQGRQQGQFPNQTGRQQGFPPQGQQQAFPQNGQPPMQQGQFLNQTGRQQVFPPQGQQQNNFLPQSAAPVAMQPPPSGFMPQAGSPQGFPLQGQFPPQSGHPQGLSQQPQLPGFVAPADTPPREFTGAGQSPQTTRSPLNTPPFDKLQNVGTFMGYPEYTLPGTGTLPGDNDSAPLTGIEGFKELIQNERNSHSFYNSLAGTPISESAKESLKSIAGRAETRERRLMEIYSGIAGRNFQPENRELKTDVGLRDGLRLAVSEESRALRSCAEMADSMQDLPLKNKLGDIMLEKLCQINELRQLMQE